MEALRGGEEEVLRGNGVYGAGMKGLRCRLHEEAIRLAKTHAVLSLPLASPPLQRWVSLADQPFSQPIGHDSSVFIWSAAFNFPDAFFFFSLLAAMRVKITCIPTPHVLPHILNPRPRALSQPTPALTPCRALTPESLEAGNCCFRCCVDCPAASMV